MKTIFKSMLVLTPLFLLPFGAKAVSMGQVLGQVTIKESNKPLPNAIIIFENGFDKITVQANEAGYYYANHTPTGRYQMRVTYNNRVFIMNKVRVYDNYDTEVNFTVSSDTSLPVTVVLETPDPIINSVTPTDIRLAESSFNQPTRSLAEVLSMQPGINVIDGNIYIKGSRQGVRFYIDGAPVMALPSLQKGW